jgi:hypothetical protein
LRMALQYQSTRARCQSAFAKSLYRGQIAYFQLQDAVRPIYRSLPLRESRAITTALPIREGAGMYRK